MEKLVVCGETMKSNVTPGHTHTCIGDHPVGGQDHFCGECRKWWGRGLGL